MTFDSMAIDSGAFGGSELDEWVFQGGDDIDSDVLFVFGTPHHIIEFASAVHRLFQTLRLRQVVISGHGGEAEALAVAACRRGVPPDVFSLERKASNTLENVTSSEGMLREACPGRQLHVLAKRYSLPRCLLTLQAVFPGWKFGLHGVDWFDVRPETWRSHPSFRCKVAQEMAKVAEYAARGDIGMPHHPWTPDKLKIISAGLAQTASVAGSASCQEGEAAPLLEVQVSVSAREHVDDMRLVTLEAHLEDGIGRSVLRTTVIERSDAVGVIAYDDRRDSVVFVEQFRAGPYIAAGLRTMLEIVAGYVDPGESEREAAQRELKEETGLVADRLIHISRYFPAPTLSTERMSLWCALVDSDLAFERTATGAERIRIVRIPGEQAVALMLEDRISNALTLTAVQWLAQVRQVLFATRQREGRP